jgi:hypothetical protein
MGSRFTPTLLAEFRDRTRVTGESLLHSMPVCVALLLHDSLILIFGCFPAGRVPWTDVKRPDVIRANKCRGE